MIRYKLSRIFTIFCGALLVYFFSWFAVYETGINSTLIQSEDALPATFLPASLSREGDFDLDEYFNLLISRYPQPDGGRVPYYLREVGGHFYSAFPVLTPLLVVPVYFVPVRLGLPVNFETAGILAHLSAALIVAASVAVMYVVFRLVTGNRGLATILSLAYAFGTCSFGLSSQALWQHGTSQLMLALALYFLVRGIGNPKKAAWAGLFLSLATLARPTGIIAVFILSLYFLKKFGLRWFIYYAVLGLIPLILFLITPGALVGVLSGYGSQLGSSWTAPFPGAFLALWFSPSKGVLTYSPVFFFSFLGLWILLRRKKDLYTGSIRTFLESPNLFYWIFACIMAHSLVVGKWYSWYGGWTFGYRMMVDMLPFLSFLWVPFAQSGYWKRLEKIFYLAFLWSLGIQLAGIVFFDGVWHNLYDEGSRMGWVWSVKNSEMVYYLRRVFGRIRGIPANQIR